MAFARGRPAQSADQPNQKTARFRAQNHHRPCKSVTPLPATSASNIRDVPPQLLGNTNKFIYTVYAQTWPTWKGRREAAFRVPQGSVCLSPKPPHRPRKSMTCRRQVSDAMLEDPRFRLKILAGRRLFVPGYRKRLILEHPAIDFCSSPKSGRSGDLGRTSVDDPKATLGLRGLT